jgi:hypothetical protein
MKKLIAVIALLALILTCTGCSLNLFSVDSLITPPAQSGKNGQVQKAFNSLMKDKKVQLKTPVYGEYQTSFVLFDVNNDGVEEAFVFYTDSSSAEGSVRMAFMECVDEKWIISSDIKGAGNGVYDVEFVDLNDDGFLEIFVSWSLLDSKTTKIVSIFELTNSGNGEITLNPLGNEYCNSKTISDFNNDGTKDLILVYLDDTGAVQKSLLRMFSLNANNQLLKFGETVLDSAISSVAAIQSDVAAIGGKSTLRLFVDCMKNDRTIFTEVVYWDSRLLVPTRLFTEPSVSNLRNSALLCTDIDNDGLLEIPTTTRLYGDENTFTVKTETDIYTFSLLTWVDALGDTDKQGIITLLNPLDHYLFLYDWGNKVTIKHDSLRDALIFCTWNEEEKKSGAELFSVTHRKSIAENEILGELLAETDKGVYYYQITEEGKAFGITDELVTSAFIKIN